jgi:alanyl-tRNA synthetase
MQYEQLDKNTRIDLPMRSIDTGMGLERVAAVLQGKSDNYDTDCFQDLVCAIEDVTKVKSTEENKFSHRIIADHLRASAFLIADGVLPSNEGRGYVLRRIMRRSMRHIHQLGSKQPVMHLLLPALTHLMADGYPELIRAASLISETLKNEEIKFKDTLGKGLKVLEEDAKSLQAGDEISGHVAFKLYDTYGFPLDLTQDILKARSIGVNLEEFNSSMQEQKIKARNAWIGSGQTQEQAIWFDIENDFGSTEFLGYSFEKSESQIIAIVADNNEVDKFSNKNQEFWLLVNQTPFYAESGGQKGDIGEISSEKFKATVVDTKKFLNLHAHLCRLESGEVELNSFVLMQIDSDVRANLKRNHSATHLLHSALKTVLGDHVTQKGSLVAADRLRLDINHNKPVTQEETEQVETIVNEVILQNLKVKTFLMNKEAAIDAGAMALFGEKYDDEVRVVSVIDNDVNFSVELCGGTHVNRTGDIGSFKIISEGSLASGIRRIEALTGIKAVEYYQKNQQILSKVSHMMQSSKDSVMSKLQELQSNLRESQKQALNLETKLLQQHFTTEAKTVGGKDFNIVYAHFTEADNKALKNALENISSFANQDALIALNKAGDSISLTITVNKNLSEIISAGDLLKKIITKLDGSGGGGKTFAQGSFKFDEKHDLQRLLASCFCSQ